MPLIKWLQEKHRQYVNLPEFRIDTRDNPNQIEYELKLRNARNLYDYQIRRIRFDRMNSVPASY